MNPITLIGLSIILLYSLTQILKFYEQGRKFQGNFYGKYQILSICSKWAKNYHFYILRNTILYNKNRQNMSNQNSIPNHPIFVTSHHV